jgi:hypothetical protein
MYKTIVAYSYMHQRFSFWKEYIIAICAEKLHWIYCKMQELVCNVFKQKPMQGQQSLSKHPVYVRLIL